jgi:hypothetical protein
MEENTVLYLWKYVIVNNYGAMMAVDRQRKNVKMEGV